MAVSFINLCELSAGSLWFSIRDDCAIEVYNGLENYAAKLALLCHWLEPLHTAIFVFCAIHDVGPRRSSMLSLIPLGNRSSARTWLKMERSRHVESTLLWCMKHWKCITCNIYVGRWYLEMAVLSRSCRYRLATSRFFLQ